MHRYLKLTDLIFRLAAKYLLLYTSALSSSVRFMGWYVRMIISCLIFFSQPLHAGLSTCEARLAENKCLSQTLSHPCWNPGSSSSATPFPSLGSSYVRGRCFQQLDHTFYCPDRPVQSTSRATDLSSQARSHRACCREHLRAPMTAIAAGNGSHNKVRSFSSSGPVCY